MAETVDNTYRTKSDNTADVTPNKVAVVNDGTGDRQIVGLGALDGTGTIVDGTTANPVNVNNSKVSGTAISVNNGTTDAGTQRVTLSSDSTGQVKLASGTNAVGTVTANAGTNLNTSALATSANLTSGSQKTQVVDGSGNVIASTNNAIDTAPIAASSDFWPFYNVQNLGGGQIKTDPAGDLVTRGAVSTDEGAGRVNFTGSAYGFALANNCTFTNGSSTVTTSSGFTTADLHFLDYIKLNSDGNWYQISFINSDTSLTLTTAYTGTTGTGASSGSGAALSVGSGASSSVATGQLTIGLGTTTSSASYLAKTDGSASGYLWNSSFAISQRIANQDIYFGIETAVNGTSTQFARFHFTGTTNTQVITETGYNPTTTPASNEQETNTVTLPGSAVTSSANTYSVEAQFDQIVFRINNVIVATHTKRIPRMMALGQNLNGLGNSIAGLLRGVNGTSPASNTNIVVDFCFIKAYDRLETNLFDTVTTTPSSTANVALETGGNLATIATQTSGLAKESGGNLATIVTNTSGLSTSANQTNASQKTQIVDASGNVASTVVAGTANSSGIAQLVGNTSYEPAAWSVTSVTAGTAYDVGNYRWVSVHILTQYTGTSPTITFQTSNDNTNWVSNALQNVAATNALPIASTTANGLILHGPIGGRYFRLNFTGTYSSGTSTGNIVFSTLPGAAQVIGGQVSALSSSTNTTLAITASNSTVTSANIQSNISGFIPISVHGSYTGVSFGITISDDAGTTFYNVPIYDTNNMNWLKPGSTITPGSNVSNVYYIPILANSVGVEVKVTASAWSTGTANIRIGGASLVPLPGSFMSQLMDAAGNARGANVDANNNLGVSTNLTPVGTKLNTNSYHITTNTTNTPTSSTAYISSIAISAEVGGTTSTITIQDKQGTPLKLVNGLATTAVSTTPTVISFTSPVLMTSGIDIITAGAVAGTVDVWISWLQ